MNEDPLLDPTDPAAGASLHSGMARHGDPACSAEADIGYESADPALLAPEWRDMLARDTGARARE